MLTFYKKAVLAFFTLLLLTFVLGLLCINRFLLKVNLLPAFESPVPWTLAMITDTQKGGASVGHIEESQLSIAYSYQLSDEVEYPDVSVVVMFIELATAHSVLDLTNYSTVSFRLRCSQNGVLMFNLHSLDKNVSKSNDLSSYRIAESLVPCQQSAEEIKVDIRHLNVAEWWLENYDLDIGDQQYNLSQVAAFSFNVSKQLPRDGLTHVQVDSLVLLGRDYRYLYWLLALCVPLWVGFTGWLMGTYTKYLRQELARKMLAGRPLAAYQQRVVDPQLESERGRLIAYVATEYANPDISLEAASAKLDMRRMLISDILKDELGYTFAAYINKLRLTEAARLLAEEMDANVAEIAYSVGYNNIPYFNRLFKKEYGCSPGTFKQLKHR